MKRETRSICRWLMMFAMVLTISLLPVQKNEAANYGLNLNGAWVSGTISTSGAVDFYTFSIANAGVVTVEYQGWSIGDSYVQVMDADQTTSFAKDSVWSSDSITPKNKIFSLALEPGVYCVKVWGYGSHTGNYTLRASFSAAGNTERENNNTFATAMPLSANSQVLGFLSMNDTVDFYSFYVPYSQTVNITYTSMIRDSYFELWNKDFQSVKKQNVYYGSEEAPKTYVYEGNLTAGTYYLKIYPYSSSNTGRYLLKWETYQPIVNVTGITIYGAKTLKKGESVTLSANVSPSNATNQAVTWHSSNTTVATVSSSSGTVTAKGVGTTTITATAADGSKVSGKCTITVTASTSSTTTKKVTSVSISGNKKIAVGSKLQLKATVRPTTATNKKVSWTSSNKSVATVSSSGKVTAKKPGKTVITAKAKDGSGKKKSVTVIVVPKKMSAPAVTSTAKKKISVTLKRQSNVSGYQIQYAKNSRFTGAKTATVSKSAKKVTISKLTRKKKYYVRTRSYIKIGSKKYYGSWSKARTVKVK